MDEVTLTGELPAGPFEFEPAMERPNQPRRTTQYVLDGVIARDVEFAVNDVRFLASGSEFDRCTFRQDARITKANLSEYGYSYSFGSLGWQRRSVYRNCTFDHVDFGLHGGGFQPDLATFEDCTFNYCAFRDFTPERCDFVDCTFIGAISSGRFYGRADAYDGEPRQNRFSGNDFSKAKPRKVEFREVDLRSCALPGGQEYIQIDDFPAKARQASVIVAGWPDAEREDAEAMLRIYGERCSEPFFRWRRYLYEPDSPLWTLLESL